MFSTPSYVLANTSVAITEIMYDLPGADKSGEWIEITNTGSSPVDLTYVSSASDKHWKLIAGSTTGGIKPYSGGSVVAPGVSAVIAVSPQEFLNTHSGWGGILFDLASVTSLKDSGELLSLQAPDGTVLDKIDYSVYAALPNANGGGDSLHCINDVCSAGSPTPGVYTENKTSGSVADVVNSQSSQNSGDNNSTTSADVVTQTTSAAKNMPAPTMIVDLGGDRTVETGAGSFFEGHVYNKAGVPLQNVRYVWNFGNGETLEGQSVFFSYQYPERYIVQLFADAGNGYSAMGRATVEVVPAEVSIAQNSDNSIIISNITHAKKELDLSLWRIDRGGSVFTIPRGTIVLAGAAVRFSSDVIKLPGDKDAKLLYPNGIVAAKTDDVDVKNNSSEISHASATSTSNNAAASVTEKRKAVVIASAVQAKSQDKNENIFGTTSVAYVGSAVPVRGVSTTALSVAGVASVTLIGVAGALYRRPRRVELEADEENNPNIDESGYELVDNVSNKDELLKNADRLACEFTLHT